MTKPYIIGIDPDADRSGIAIWDRENKRLELPDCMSFFRLFDFLRANADKIAIVYIEAGWLNKKSNYHTRPGQTKKVGERIAKNVGANHETGKKIVEMCVYLQLNHDIVKPQGKVDSKYFQSITGIKTSNQEQRDAALLVYGR